MNHLVPRAFVSCSLRDEDKPFVEWMFAVIQRFGFQPIGPVGRNLYAPLPIYQQMKDGIREADCLVLVATPRYIQEDIHNRKLGNGISEMLHVEVGMATMSERPVLAFVQKGTDVGGFLPSLVQYIEIDPNSQADIDSNWPAISNYFRSALLLIQQRWVEDNRKSLFKGIGLILGIIGAAKVVDSIFSDQDSIEDEY